MKFHVGRYGRLAISFNGPFTHLSIPIILWLQLRAKRDKES